MCWPEVDRRHIKDMSWQLGCTQLLSQLSTANDNTTGCSCLEDAIRPAGAISAAKHLRPVEEVGVWVVHVVHVAIVMNLTHAVLHTSALAHATIIDACA